MSFIVVGTNHRYSNIELREKVSFLKGRIKEALELLVKREAIRAALILSTCNRLEIYADSDDPETGSGEIVKFISSYRHIDKQNILPYLYIYENKDALSHLFLVACGLDSLVLGETEILGQIKYAFSQSQEANAADGLLNNVFSCAIAFAGRMHRETNLSEGKVSVATVAIDFIKQRTGSLSDKKILIIGTGKISALVLQYLKKEKLNIVFISNRTFDKAKALADSIGAQAVRFDNIKHYIKQADIVITATSSPHHVIKKDMLESILNKELLIIDLALPRDVEDEVMELDKVKLFCLEDLDSVIKSNISRKADQAKMVRKIISIEVDKICKRLIEPRQEEAPLLLSK